MCHVTLIGMCHVTLSVFIKITAIKFLIAENILPHSVLLKLERETKGENGRGKGQNNKE